MSDYVTISINRDTYRKLETLADRFNLPKLKVVDMALGKFLDTDEKEARRFYQKWQKLSSELNLPEKNVRSRDLKIENVYTY